MRLLKVFSLKLTLGLSIIISLYDSSIFTSGFPQWVWNPDAATAPSQGNGGTRVAFTNREADSVNSVGGDQAKIKLSDSQARLFPQILGAITQYLSGGSSFNRPNSDGSSSGSNSGDSNSGNYPGNGGSGGTSDTCKGADCNSQCNCVEANLCFLPNKQSGNCDGGSRVRCCSTTRADENRYGNGVRTVTRSQIRRQLLRNIVSGSGSLLDDTLDLFLHPFLSKEDQLKVATRVMVDG